MRRPLMVGGYTSPATPPPFNRAPVVDLNGVTVGRDTSVFFVEGDPRVTLASAATVTDLDNNPIVYMSISCVDISGDDEYLWFNDEQFPLLFDKTAIASNGVVDFSVQYVAATQTFLVTVAGGGSTSLANVQSFIRLISYENLSVPVSSGDRSFIFVVNDNVNNSNPATCVVNVSGVNYAPEIDLNGIDSGNTISHTFVEGDTLLSLCPAASISDFDNDPLFSMSLVLTGVTADDESITIGSPGVSFSLDIDNTQVVSAGLATFEVSYTSGNTTFQIVPNGISDSPISNWQSLLRTVKYLNNSAPTTPGDRIVSVFVDDNIDTSIPVDITVTVESVSNNPPSINLGSGNNYSSTFVKGASPTSICPSATIADLDGDPLSSITIVGSSISNGVDEVILINGVSFPLNSNLSATTTVGSTLFGISYTTSSQTFVITKSGGGTFSISDAQSLVRTVSYKNTSSSPTYGNRTFTFTVNDGEDDSNSPVATVNFRNTLNIVSNGSGGGTWSSVGTWVGGVVPQDGDTVDIVATDTVNIASSVSCGSYTGTLPGIRLRGTSSSVYAKLTVADGATLTVKGVNVLTYPAIHIERYARFEPQPGATVICDGTTSSQTGILVRGIMDAIGTLEKPITFTMPSDGINWNTSVSSYSRPAGTLLWKYDQDRSIACVAFQDSNISNASGTGIGSYLDTSVAFTSKSPSTLSTNETVYDRSGLYSLVECSGVTDGLVLGNRVETYGLIGIKIDDEQCEARWNHVLSHGVITNHPGILVRGGATSSANACHVHYNTVFSNPGHCLAIDRLLGNAHSYGNTATNNRLIYYSIRPNVEYGWLQFDVIRSNDYGSTTSARIFDFSIDNNYIDIHCRLDTRHAPPSYAYIGGVSCVWNGTGNVIHDNVIKIRAVDPEVYGWGIDVGNSLSNPVVDIYNNHITTDWFAFLQGQYSDDSENLLFRSNTIVRGPNYTASYAPFGMHVSAATMFTNGEFRDTTIDFGSIETFTLAPNSGSESIGQPYTWDVSGTLTLTVSNGSSPIVGASVSITNAQSTVVFSGTTDVNGQVRPVLKKTRVSRNSGVYTYTNYNAHTISVSATGYTAQNVSHTAAIVPESRTITMVPV